MKREAKVTDTSLIPFKLDTNREAVATNFKNFAIGTALIVGASIEEIADRLSVQVSTAQVMVTKFKHDFTHYAYEFECRTGKVISADTKPMLVARMRLCGIYIASTARMSDILNRNYGVYSFRGKYIGQFYQVRKVRRLKVKKSHLEMNR